MKFYTLDNAVQVQLSRNHPALQKKVKPFHCFLLRNGYNMWLLSKLKVERSLKFSGLSGLFAPKCSLNNLKFWLQFSSRNIAECGWKMRYLLPLAVFWNWSVWMLVTGQEMKEKKNVQAREPLFWNWRRSPSILISAFRRKQVPCVSADLADFPWWD